MGLNHKIAIRPSFIKGESPPALKPARGAHDGHGLIHHPLADTEVVVDPALHFLVLGDLFGLETGAGNNPHARDPVHGCARGFTELAGLSSCMGVCFQKLLRLEVNKA